MMMRLARCALISLALTGLVACGGGGSKATPAATPATPATPMPEMQIMPKDEPGTIADAVAITGDDPVSGSLSSPTDVDFFRLALDGPSTVTFWTTGEAETVVTLVDEDGNSLSAAGAGTTLRTSGTGATLATAAGAVPADSAGRVSVTTGLDDVYARVTGQEDGDAGDYDLHHEETPNRAPSSKSLPAITVKAGGAAGTVDLSEFFSDPEGGALTFKASLPAGSIGPVSLGLTVSGSVVSVISPSGLTPGPVSITVTATDPFGLFKAEILSVTVQPADNANPGGPDESLACVSATSPRVVSPGTCNAVWPGTSDYEVTFTNSCSGSASARFRWKPESCNPDSSPGSCNRWGGGDRGLGTGGETRVRSLCTSIAPEFEYCAYLGTSSERCYGDNPMWRTP